MIASEVPKARKLKEITYDEMLDLATLGAGVLHNRSVEMAKKYGVQLVVRSSLYQRMERLCRCRRISHMAAGNVFIHFLSWYILPVSMIWIL